MADTLPDLRVTIAKSMRALANAHETDPGRWMEALRGADTLEWCASYEATPTDGERDELERLRKLADVIDDVLTRINVDGEREHPVAKLSAIRATYGKLVRDVCV